MQANYERKILSLGSEIGCGSYGRVFEATLGNKPVAVKVLHDSLLDSKDFKLIVDKFRKECELLQRLNHKNVVKLIQYSISYSSNSFLITELLACDLGKYITSLQPGKITFPEVVSIMLDVAQGLHYLHYECNPAIVHRDLASKNILLTKTRQAKIADVGIAKFFPRKQSKMFASPVPGTPLYLAPETWPHQETTETAATLPDVAYNEKIDIFSFGVVLMEAINGREPKCYPAAFDTAGRRIPENERRKDDIRQMGDHRLKGLVLRCIEDNSDERLNAEEVVDWLQKAKMSKIEWRRTIVLQRQPNKPPNLKIITLGEAATGKTCIIKRFVNDCFDDKVVPTIGLDVRFTNIKVYGRQFSLQVVDTAGLETFSSLPSSYLRGAVGVLLVFDVTNPWSFIKSIPEMLKLIHPGDDTDDKRMILVGNKADAGDQRKVTRRQAETFAANLGVLYFETSAVTGQNIRKVFEEITKVIYITSDLTNPTAKDALVLSGLQKETPTSSGCGQC